MKKQLLHFFKKKSSLVLFAFVLFFASCAIDGYNDETFSSDVKNAQLEAIDAQKVSISTVISSDGQEQLNIEWPVVYGAGGYQFTLYNIDDPDNRVAVGTENELIDGCVVKRQKDDDTKYQIVILVMGDEKLNNKGAVSPTVIDYATLLPVFATIPSGSDLGTYFEENPVQPLEAGIDEIVYQLEAGGDYTMSSNVALKLTSLTIRGDKIDHAKLKVTGSSSFISDGAGFKLKWMDIDMEDYTGKGFISYNSTLNPDALADNNCYATKSSNQIASCNITNLKKPILYDNGKKYILFDFLFKDCIIEQNLSSSEYFVDFSTGAIKDMRMVSSTFYNKTQTSNNWIRYGGVRFDKSDNIPFPDWTTAGVNIQNCTFWQIAYGKQIFNANGFGKSANYVTILKSIFVDCGSGQVTRRFLMGSTNPTRTFNLNTYWYKGETPGEETKYDATPINIDPKLKDTANGDFTVGAAAQLTDATGDPRWLPSTVE